MCSVRFVCVCARVYIFISVHLCICHSQRTSPQCSSQHPQSISSHSRGRTLCISWLLRTQRAQQCCSLWIQVLERRHSPLLAYSSGRPLLSPRIHTLSTSLSQMIAILKLKLRFRYVCKVPVYGGLPVEGYRLK